MDKSICKVRLERVSVRKRLPRLGPVHTGKFRNAEDTEKRNNHVSVSRYCWNSTGTLTATHVYYCCLLCSILCIIWCPVPRVFSGVSAKRAQERRWRLLHL